MGTLRRRKHRRMHSACCRTLRWTSTAGARRAMNADIEAIRLACTAEAAWGTAGVHQLAFRNNHVPERGVYLANALVPTTDAITITGQYRDALEHA
jgi:hypothetical protein